MHQTEALLLKYYPNSIHWESTFDHCMVCKLQPAQLKHHMSPEADKARHHSTVSTAPKPLLQLLLLQHSYCTSIITAVDGYPANFIKHLYCCGVAAPYLFSCPSPITAAAASDYPAAPALLLLLLFLVIQLLQWLLRQLLSSSNQTHHSPELPLTQPQLLQAAHRPLRTPAAAAGAVLHVDIISNHLQRLYKLFPRVICKELGDYCVI